LCLDGVASAYRTTSSDVDLSRLKLLPKLKSSTMQTKQLGNRLA